MYEPYHERNESRGPRPMTVGDRILIALVPEPRDLALARERGIYRVPLAHAPAMLATAGALAFYQPASFGAERWQVAWWAEQRSLEVMPRRELLPDEPTHRRAAELYAVVRLGPLLPVEPPKRAAKGRRILFVPTTWGAFQRATSLDALLEKRPRPIADAPLYQILKRQTAGHDGIPDPDTPHQLRLLEDEVEFEALDWRASRPECTSIMPRKAIRINARPPSDEVAATYFDFWVQGDLYRHPERFPALTSEALFDNQHPLAIEVGPGTGEWLVSMAEQQPEWNFLGIDIYAKALYRAVAAAHEASLTNIYFIRAPIQFTYPLFQPQSLVALYLHYPDPNLRSRGQHKIVNPTFFEVAARALVPGGTLSLITDHEALFFEELLPLVEADGRWSRQHEARYLVGFEPEVKSRYQKMWEKHDVPPLRLLLERRETETEETRNQ